MIDYLQAVTICVNYADVLKWILPNRRHFNRWLIVTHKSDRATLELCRKHGLETLCSRRLYQGGAVFHKAKALNDGLDALKPGEWTVVMDSDILLPPDFRKRLERERLNWRSLYGMRGRRVCLTGNAFEVLKSHGPWTRVAHSSTILGYFQLFHLSQTRNRYPEHISTDASSYDMAFADSFPSRLRRRLPMNCLHLGPVKENWQGRKTRKFGKERSRKGYRTFPDEGLENLPAAAAALKRRRLGFRQVVQVGYFLPETTNELCRHFDRVWLVDCWRVDDPDETDEFPGITEANRLLYWSGLESPGQITRLGCCDSSVFAGLEEESVDALYLDGEFNADALLDILRAAGPSLRRPAYAIGWGFGISHFPESTEHIAAAVGVPEVIAKDTTWAKRIDASKGIQRTGRSRLLEGANLDQAGFVFSCRDLPDIEKAFLSILRLRSRIGGRYAVIYSGSPSPVLSALAAKLGVEFISSGLLGAGKTRAMADLRAVRFTPFESTIVLNGSADFDPSSLKTVAGQLKSAGGAVFMDPSPESQWEHLDRILRVAALNLPRISRSELIRAAQSGSAIRRDCWAFSITPSPGEDVKDSGTPFLERVTRLAQALDANEMTDSAGSALQLAAANSLENFIRDADSGGSPSVSDDDDEIASLALLSQAFASDIRIPPGVAVVTAIIPENLESFRAIHPLWQFLSENHLYVFSANLDRGDLAFLDQRKRTSVHPIEVTHGYDPEYAAGEALIRGIPAQVSQSYCIYINAGCRPRRGAELFLSKNWRRFAIVGCGWIGRRTAKPDFDPADPFVSPLEKIAAPEILNGIGMFRSALVENALQIFNDGWHLPNFDRLLAMSAIFADGETTAAAKLSNWGWEDV